MHNCPDQVACLGESYAGQTLYVSRHKWGVSWVESPNQPIPSHNEPLGAVTFDAQGRVARYEPACA